MIMPNSEICDLASLKIKTLQVKLKMAKQKMVMLILAIYQAMVTAVIQVTEATAVINEL